MRLLPLLAALLCSALASAPAHADEVEIANDKIGNMGMASLNFGGQLIKGEAVAETFTIPLNYLPFTITKARFFAGPAGMAGLTFVLYEELGTPTPGKELARITPKDEVEGNTMFIQDVDLPATVVNSKNVRLAIYPDRDTTNGGVAIPFDPAGPNLGTGTICSIDILMPNSECKWIRANSVGVRGPFIIRLVGETSAALPDGGGTGDMAGGGGRDMAGGTVQPGDLSISSINPGMLPQDKGGKLVVLGGGFTLNTTITLVGDSGPVKLSNTLLENAGAISAAVQSGLPLGSYDVVAQNPDGTTARLPKALAITAEAKGCDATLGARDVGAGGAGALGLLLCAALLRRRREATR